jgi:phage terminase large subunit
VTTSTAAELERRRRDLGRGELVTFTSDFRDLLISHLGATTGIKFPDERWWQDPIRFRRDILGIDTWSRQQELILAVRDHPRCACKSGHKCSKSNSAASISLCFYCSFRDAQVVMSSTTARQVDQILWRELKMLRARGGRCLDCKLRDPEGLRIERPCPHSALIDGEIGEMARTGLKSADFRQITGFTAKEAEAVAGVSGARVLFIFDEASGVPDEIYEATEGNRAGGARVLLLGNPTRTSGEFFDAFNEKSRFYFTMTISSEETPNVVEGREVIPGLAGREWIEEKREEWGEESALYKVRVKGEFAVAEDGKIFSIHTIEIAEQRWPETSPSGRLYIGLDPAGESGAGDETVFTPRRGLKAFSQLALRGLSEEAHVVHLLSLIRQYSLPREKAVVVMDREGSIGAKVYGRLAQIAAPEDGPFDLVGLRSSDRAHRQPAIFDRVRDELASNLEAWFRDGGAIAEDSKLAKELHELEWKVQSNGRVKLTPKDVLRKALGRSPDRYDSLAYSAWEPLSLRSPPASVQRATPAAEHNHASATFDPYSGMSPFERR